MKFHGLKSLLELGRISIYFGLLLKDPETFNGAMPPRGKFASQRTENSSLDELARWNFWPSPGFTWVYRIWVNYNDLTTTSLEIMVSKGNHPKMALIQVSELL